MSNFSHCVRNHYFVAFFSSLIISVGLLITSFFLPPQGQIDPSVLQATAIILVYPALAFGMKALDDNKRVRISTKVGTFTVGDHHEHEHPDHLNEDDFIAEGEQYED